MHSVPFFTTSPTPSPTRPLHVPYTSPTSPTNTQGFCTSLQTAHVALLKMWQRLRLAWHDQVLRVASRRWAMAWGVVAKDVDASPSCWGPSRAKKNVPSIRPGPGPRSPTPCKVGCQQSRSGDRFTVAKKSFPSCSRQVCRQSQHCKGGGGRSWPWTAVGKCRGDVFFARDGKGIHSDHAGICAWRNFARALATCPGHHFVITTTFMPV